MQWPERRKECRSLAARGLAVATLLLVGVLPARALVIDAQYNAQESASPDFDPTGQLLQAMVTEATGLWQEIVRDPCAVQIDFGWEDLDDAAATLGVEVTLGSFQGKPTRARIRFDTQLNGVDRPWYIDPTPRDNTEFDLRQTRVDGLTATDRDAWYSGAVPDWLEVAFAGRATASAPAAARGSYDLFSIVTHELGHALGLAPLIATGETLDGDYDIPPDLVDGAVMGVATFNPTNTAHLAAEGALMFPSFGLGDRRLPSATDILALASATGWSDLVMPGMPGDMDGDGEIDPDDSLAFALGLNDPAGYAAMFSLDAVRRGDIDGDGDLDFDDIPPFATAVTAAFDAAAVPTFGSVALAVPEPPTATLLWLAVVLVILCCLPLPAARRWVGGCETERLRPDSDWDRLC